MKLSQFEINKVIKFNGSEVEIVENSIEDQIQFYNLTYDRIISIKENVIDKLDNNAENDKFFYMIIPYICDLELDRDDKYFSNLVKIPPKQFTYFYEAIIDIINNLFDSVQRLNEVENKINEMQDKMPDINTMLKVETKEDKLKRLNADLDLAMIQKDREAIKRLSIEISELEASDE